MVEIETKRPHLKKKKKSYFTIRQRANSHMRRHNGEIKRYKIEINSPPALFTRSDP